MSAHAAEVAERREMRRGIDLWPISVPLCSVTSHGGRALAKARGRTTPAHKAALRRAGWSSGSGGWWLVPESS